LTIIREIQLRTILDSRGNPTVEADVLTENGFGRAAAPSGASTGRYEARVRPAEEAVKNAVRNVVPPLMGEDAADQVLIDGILRESDGTRDFSAIGANVAVAISLANAGAAASAMGMELFRYLGGAFTAGTPLPLGNVIGGGAHAPDATDIQEFLVVPTGARSAFEAISANAAVHRKVRELLKKAGKTAGKGDEGAWAPSIPDVRAFEIVTEAAAAVSDELSVAVRVGIDMAASQLWDEKEGKYRYRESALTTEEQVAYVADLVERFGLIYVEDPLHEEDFAGFADLTGRVGDRCLVCGDDLFVTQSDRIAKGIDEGAGNCVLIKPNQVGTLTETFEAIRLAHTNGLDTVMSHRSGETTDTAIAHLATAFECIFLKTGVVGGERTAKLNELVRIEELIE
jgi:enolase